MGQIGFQRGIFPKISPFSKFSKLVWFLTSPFFPNLVGRKMENFGTKIATPLGKNGNPLVTIPRVFGFLEKR